MNFDTMLSSLKKYNRDDRRIFSRQAWENLKNIKYIEKLYHDLIIITVKQKKSNYERSEEYQPTQEDIDAEDWFKYTQQVLQLEADQLKMRFK